MRTRKIPTDFLPVPKARAIQDVYKRQPLEIGELTAPRPKLPEHMLSEPTDSSRVLRAAEERNLERQAKRNSALSFSKIEGGE